MSTFRRSLPVTLTSFINRAGSIGLSIVPILLVERHLSTDQSAWIMGSIKATGLLGILVGGWLSDALGLRWALVLAFLISGLGLAPMPFMASAFGLAAFGCLAQLGSAMYYPSARLLITQLVPHEERNAAIAWQRTANNLAQVISYSLGALLGRFGATFLILFDALTSFAATGVGARILPSPAMDHFKPASAASDRGGSAGLATRRNFYRCAVIIASFSFLYELYSVGAAARCKLLFGEHGLEVFSEIMVINTVMCALLSVVAAKHLTRAARVLPVGMTLLVLGLVVTFAGESSGRVAFFIGIFVMTLGEIVFNALAGLVLIHFTPEGRHQGTMYSTGVFIQFSGRITGGALAFPLLVGSAHPLTWVMVACVPPLLLVWTARGLLGRVS